MEQSSILFPAHWKMFLENQSGQNGIILNCSEAFNVTQRKQMSKYG